MRRALVILAIVFSVINTCAEQLGARTVVYVAKPLATLALVAMVLGIASASRYRTMIAAGLVASLAGDILLMVPRDLFVLGLLAFLVAHVCYITAFATDGAGLRAPLIPALPIYAIAAVVLMRLWPTLGAMRVPVVCYVTVISTMAWQAIARWQVQRTPDAALAAVGSVFFLASDGSLAVRRFIGPFAGGALVVLATYHVAQLAIALSVRDNASHRA